MTIHAPHTAEMARKLHSLSMNEAGVQDTMAKARTGLDVPRRWRFRPFVARSLVAVLCGGVALFVLHERMGWVPADTQAALLSAIVPTASSKPAALEHVAMPVPQAPLATAPSATPPPVAAILVSGHVVAVYSALLDCYDNSAVESFFKSLKAELVWRHNWQTRREVEVALFDYINGFYNPRRKHSALGWKSPVAFEQRAA